MNQDEHDKLNRRLAEALGWTNVRIVEYNDRDGNQVVLQGMQPNSVRHPRDVLAPRFTRDPAAALDAARVIMGPFGYWHLCPPHNDDNDRWCAVWESRHFEADTPAEALALMCGAVLDVAETKGD